MQTEDLVAKLADGATVVPGNVMSKRLVVSLGIGLMVAIVLQLMTAGYREDFALAWTLIAMKFAACVSAGAIWFWFLRHLAAPGIGTTTQRLAAIGALGVIALIASFAPFEFSALGKCVTQVFFLAVPAFAALVVALRGCAPTRLIEVGFVAGIVAGALGTVGYSLDCVADDPTVVAFRYGAAVLVCGALGALAGRYVLRW